MFNATWSRAATLLVPTMTENENIKTEDYPVRVWTDDRGLRWMMCACQHSMHIHTPWRVREDDSAILPSDHPFQRPSMFQRLAGSGQCRACDSPKAWHRAWVGIPRHSLTLAEASRQAGQAVGRDLVPSMWIHAGEG